MIDENKNKIYTTKNNSNTKVQIIKLENNDR